MSVAFANIGQAVSIVLVVYHAHSSEQARKQEKNFAIHIILKLILWLLT